MCLNWVWAGFVQVQAKPAGYDQDGTWVVPRAVMGRWKGGLLYTCSQDVHIARETRDLGKRPRLQAPGSWQEGDPRQAERNQAAFQEARAMYCCCLLSTSV